MLQYIIEKRWLQLLFIFVLVLSLSAVITKIEYIIGVVVSLFILLRYKANIIPITITILLVFVSDINTELRTFITALSAVTIAFYFIKEYGLAYSAYPRMPYQIELYLVLVLSALFISSILSSDFSICIIEVFRLLFFVIFIYLLYALLKYTNEIFKYIYALIAAGLILSLSIMANFFYSDIPIYLLQKGVIQEGGILKNVSAAGGMLAVSIPLNISAVFINSEKNKRKLFFIFLVIQVIALLLTNSRAAILSVLISSGYIHYFLARKYLKKTLLVILGVSIILFIISPGIFQLVLLYFRVDRVFENTRYYLWDIAMSIFKDNPVFGVGPGMFKEHIYDYLPVRLNGWDEQQIEWVYSYAGIGHAHNFFLFYLAELGIIGLLAALFLPILFISFSYTTSKLVKTNKKLYSVAVGITGMGLGMFVRALFESTGLLTYGWITRDLPFWVCFIVILFLYRQFSKPGLNTLLNNLKLK